MHVGILISHIFYHTCFILAPDSLRKPKLYKTMECQVEKITVSLGGSIDKFEEELCRILNDDRMARTNQPPDGTSLHVLKRQLTVIS